MPELGHNIIRSPHFAHQAVQRDLRNHLQYYSDALVEAHLAGDTEAIDNFTLRMDEVNAQLLAGDPNYVVKLGLHCDVRRN